MYKGQDPQSATAKFCINVKNNDFLNHTSKDSQGWGYCVFGKVTQGMETVNKIKAVDTGTRAGHQDVPTEPVIIEKASVGE